MAGSSGQTERGSGRHSCVVSDQTRQRLSSSSPPPPSLSLCGLSLTTSAARLPSPCPPWMLYVLLKPLSAKRVMAAQNVRPWLFGLKPPPSAAQLHHAAHNRRQTAQGLKTCYRGGWTGLGE
eukprot:TRINITY_DN3437_c0_g1_i1.p1 TRINITY_DN3437_c0_g1~~TRINITY_DN3437_c0_g1_i1.p1  ORF type:complete len:136 (+),score=11.31 TRINITY_DN3437_c0_g1_i1:44-409(+)